MPTRRSIWQAIKCTARLLPAHMVRQLLQSQGLSPTMLLWGYKSERPTFLLLQHTTTQAMKVFVLVKSVRVSSSKAQSTRDSTLLPRSQKLGHRRVCDPRLNRPIFYQDCESSVVHQSACFRT